MRNLPGARSTNETPLPADNQRDSEYVSGAEAAALLGVKPQTLYTYVSRGVIQSLPTPNGQRHLYLRADIEKLRARPRARRTLGAVAASAMYAGDPIISTLAAVLFLIAIGAAVIFWVLYVSPTLLAAEETARTSTVPAYYEILQVSAESSLGVYQLLGLMATAGFGWALLQTGMLPSWVGWLTLGFGVVWAGVFLKTSEAIPLLPMVMQVVIGVSLLLK